LVFLLKSFMTQTLNNQIAKPKPPNKKANPPLLDNPSFFLFLSLMQVPSSVTPIFVQRLLFLLITKVTDTLDSSYNYRKLDLYG
jgi:hypothetical protein